jgi:uncharacterized membrane protein
MKIGFDRSAWQEENILSSNTNRHSSRPLDQHDTQRIENHRHDGRASTGRARIVMHIEHAKIFIIYECNAELWHLNNPIGLFTHGFLVVVFIISLLILIIIITFVFFILVEHLIKNDPMKICGHLRDSRSPRRHRLQQQHHVASSWRAGWEEP